MSDLDLSLNELRRKNAARVAHFKNSKGEPAHSEPDGSDWSLCEWSNAVCGEAGEMANVCKKMLRGDLDLETNREVLAEEIADVLCYLDLLAYRAGINLAEATVRKWNKVSEKIGYPERLRLT